MKSKHKKLGVNTLSTTPSMGVESARRTAPRESPRKPTLDNPLKSPPAGNGGSKTFGSV